MDLDYEKDMLVLLKILAYKMKDFEYRYPFVKTAKTDTPWLELYVGEEELQENRLSLSKAEKLFSGVCRKQGLTPEDFMDEVISYNDKTNETDLFFKVKTSEDGKGIIIPALLLIEDVIKNINKTKNSELIEKKFNINNKLTLNGLDGEFTYNKVSGRMSVKSRQYKILRTLLLTENNFATYQNLLKVILPEKEYSKLDNKLLTDAIQLLKEQLGILPKTENSNPNCFKNITQSGYRLEISE